MNFIPDHIRTIIYVLYIIMIMITVGMIIHDRRDPVRTLGWMSVIIFLPVGGIFLYILVGRNHRKEKIFNLKELHDLEQVETLCQKQLDDLVDQDKLQDPLVEANRHIITLLLNNSKALLTTHNRVTILNNGKETFPSLLAAIDSATQSIHLEYYIFESDSIGHILGEKLMAKARSGVEVRIIYDDVGSWDLNRKYIARLRAAGVELCCFMPVAFPWLTSRINYRNHRKIAVIDGKIGFTGGINIADRYNKGTKFGPWRDTHLRIEGQAVRMLQMIFITDWYFVSNRTLLNQAKYFPKTHVRNFSPLQIASSGPDSDWASIMQAFFAAISRARESIYIATPYFMPNQAVLTAMKVAALSGVDVRIILPSRSDSKLVYWASRSYISELLDAGIKVYFYRRGFIHSKLIIVDDQFCTVGSANMDIRSFEDNFEVTALIYDPQVTKQLKESFMDDMAGSTLITATEWEKRSNLHAAYESVSRLLSPLL